MSRYSNYVIGSTAEDSYLQLLKLMKDKGEMQGKNRELLDLNLVIINPELNFIRIKKLWTWAIWELYDRLDPKFQNPGNAHAFRPNWRKKLEKEGGRFTYTYGTTYRKWIPHVLKKLRSKGTRDCVLTMWENRYLKTRSRTPCTLNLHFMIRKDALDLYVDMRTNDIINLLPYDIWHHTNLQIIIARILGINVGTYRHKAHTAYWQKRRDGSKHVSESIEILSNIYPYQIYPETSDTMGSDIDNLYAAVKILFEGKTVNWYEIIQSINSILVKEWLITLVRSHTKLILNKQAKLPEPQRFDFRFIWQSIK